jgi:glycosyltransferase involved in cell wall biosynthesis
LSQSGVEPGCVEVSVILPCLNEVETVGECVRQARSWLEAAGLAGEVIVVDNGSTDGSQGAAHDARAKVVVEPRRGKGHAVATGIAVSSGAVIVLADSDGTYDLRDLDSLIAPLRQGVDMVGGNRLAGAMEAGAMPWLHRHVGNPLFTALIGLITGQRFGDCLTGLRAFTRDAWERMAPQATGFELESEICLRAGRRRLRIAEVPAPYGARRVQSKLRALTHGWEIAKFIILDSADIIFFAPAAIAFILGVISLAIGTLATSGVDIGSSRWQPVFAGGILIPAATALMTLGVTAKWLAWRRGIADAGWLTGALQGTRPVFEILLFLGIALLAGGLALDGFLLFRWNTNNPPPLPLGLGAIAQSMVVAGLNLIVTALLFGVLRLSSPPSDGRAND